MKKTYLLALYVALASVSFGATFNTSTIGGTATVGTGGDYTSLKEAADAFNALGSPYLQGDWKLEILNDLNEPVNAAFGNTIPNGSSLTLKPAATTSVTLTFESTIDNGGGSGNLVIGDNDVANWTMIPTNNFTVDGSNNGTDSRNMTIQNTAAVTHITNSPVSILGASSNVTVKNTTIKNVSAATGSSPAGIAVATRIDTALGTVEAPQNISIINNSIVVPQAQGHGINFRQSVSATPAPATIQSVTGTRIINNDIVARIRGIFMDNGLDAEITSNTIRVGVSANTTGYPQPAIWINNSRSTSNQVANITSNSIVVRSHNTFAGDYGPVAIRLGGGGATNQANVINNMIALEYTSTANVVANYMAIQGLSAYTYNILHNSISMPHFATQSGFTPARAAGIKMPETVAYTATIRNNIVRVDQPGAAAISLVSNVTPTVESNNNILFRSRTGTFTGASGTVAAPVTHETLTNWQGTGRDANSQAVDPTATANSQWTFANGPDDLHFYPSNLKPAGITLQPRLAQVPLDVDGTPRDALTVPGADEVLEFPASVDQWSMY